jgi:Uma2 family endonuclease
MLLQEPGIRTMTIADYHTFIDQEENANHIYELMDGELVEKMPSFEPSRFALEIAYAFMAYLKKNPIGYVTGADGGYILSDDTILIPDVGYISKVRMTEIPEREVLVAPDIAVEVMSPTDRKRALRAKAERYLQHGTRIVWLVFPATRTVDVYSADGDIEELSMGGILSGGDVLPGFTLPVADIFGEQA